MDIFDSLQPDDIAASSGDIFDQINYEPSTMDVIKDVTSTPLMSGKEMLANLVFPAYGGLKALGRIGEAGQFAIDAAATDKPILQESARGLKGEDISGDQLNKDLFGFDESTMAQDIESKLTPIVGSKIAKVAGDLPRMLGFAPTLVDTTDGKLKLTNQRNDNTIEAASPYITPSTISEMLIDPVNIAASGIGKIAELPKFLSSGAKVAEEVAKTASVAEDAANLSKATTEVPSVIPMGESNLVKAGQNIIDQANTPRLPAPIPPKMPPAYMTEKPTELAQKFVNDPNMTIPDLIKPNYITGDPAKSLPFDLRMKALSATEAAPSSRIPVRGTYKFDDTGKIIDYAEPAQKMDDLNVFQLINKYLGEKGSVGSGKKTAEQIAAKNEIYRRAKLQAEKTGENVQDLFMKAVKNPAILDQEVDNIFSSATKSNEPILPKEFKSPQAGNGQSIQELNREAWQVAQSKANAAKDAAIQSGKDFSKKDLTKTVAAMYKAQRKSIGLPTEVKTDVADLSLKNIFKNHVNLANDIERETGVEAGGYVNKLINAEFERGHFLKDLEQVADDKSIRKRLRKLGVSDNEVTRLMHYVESTPDGPRFTRNALTRADKKTGQQIIDMPEFDGVDPSPQVLQELYKLRSSDDAMHNLAKSRKIDLGYHPRYVHRSPKIPLLSGASGDQSIYNPAIFRKRSYENLPLEKNYWKIRERYKRQLAREAAFSKILPQGRETSLQLRMLGNDAAAEKIDKLTANAMGLGNVKELKRKQIEDIIGKSDEKLDEMRKELGLDDSEFDKILAMVNDQSYHGLIGVNFKNMVAQIFQPELTGIPEVGLLNTELKRLPAMWTKADKEAISAVQKRLRGAHYNPGEVTDLPTVRKAGGVIGNILKFPGNIGLKVQDYVDDIGRKSIFLAARRQFLRSKNPVKVFADMMDFEKQAIRDALKAGDIEKAAREYALLRSQRVMHRFSSVDKPMWMQTSKFGKMVPFTTFGRGEGNKMVSDLKAWRSGNKAAGVMLAKRIAYPLLISSGLVAAGHGDMASYTNPQLSVGGLARIGLPPSIQALGKVTSDPKQALKDASKQIALPRFIQMLTPDKRSKKRTSGGARRKRR